MAQKVKTQLNDPIEVLIREHEEGLKKLSKIVDAADSIEKNGFSGQAFQELIGAVEYISTRMRQHHDKEEKFLFPLLEKHVFESPNIIWHERREIWQAFNGLATTIKDVEDGRIHGTTIHELIQSCHIVVGIFIKHIINENTILFPLVKRVLRVEEYEQLRRDILSVN